MTVLIPILILGGIVGAIGFYYAANEGKVQHGEISKRSDRNGATIPQPRTQPDESARLEQPPRGVSLEPQHH